MLYRKDFDFLLSIVKPDFRQVTRVKCTLSGTDGYFAQEMSYLGKRQFANRSFYLLKSMSEGQFIT